MTDSTGKSMSETLIFALTSPQYCKIFLMKIANCNLRTLGEHAPVQLVNTHYKPAYNSFNSYI